MNNMDDEVKRTIDSLDNIEKAEVKPFFYTRLQAKLASNQKQEKWQLRIAWGSLALVVVINLLVVSQTEFYSSSDNNANSITELNEEYSSIESDIYTLIEDYENE